MKKSDTKDLILIISFIALLSANYALGFESYKAGKKSVDLKEPVEEVNDKDAFINLMEEKRVAYYIQKSGIKMDGSITKPRYFGKLPNEYKNLIIITKDFDKENLAYYLKMNIDRDEALVFERELADLKNSEFMKASYQR